MTTKKSKGKQTSTGMRAGPAVMAKIRQKQYTADALSLPLITMTDFPDEAFEGFSKQPEPECAVCEGSLRAGQILVVLDKGRISHLSCFEGTKVHAAKGSDEPATIRETPDCNGDKDGCDGQIVEEYDLKIGKKKIRVAITGYHHGSSGHAGPWEYYHVGEIIKHPEGGTEIEELLPDPFPKKPTADDIKKALA